MLGPSYLQYIFFQHKYTNLRASPGDTILPLLYHINVLTSDEQICIETEFKFYYKFRFPVLYLNSG